MKKILTLFAASTALAAVIGVPASSAVKTPIDGVLRSVTTFSDDAPQTMPLVLASDDDDDGHHWREASRRSHDDDDDDDEDDCDDDDDDGCRAGARNPAPAGAVAPPQNGLFGNGAPPQVQVN